MPTVFDVADYFIVATRCDCENGQNDDVITHLKLQKLVYYAQGFSLAFNNEPLFDEPIEAWDHGPVCPQLYQKYKSFGREPINSNLHLDDVCSKFTERQLEILEIVNENFGCLTGSMLRRVSHSDSAWINARSRGGDIITLDEMKTSCLERLQVDENEA
jgi:uncharacterized phage-associated protein